MSKFEKVPQQVIDTVRVLSMDGVQQANSGHPGTPMGAAELSLVLWSHFLRFNPQQPTWRDRDRFILSAGHASMLLYSLLHLFDFDCGTDDLRAFRQMDSRTAGHPELGHLPGIEMTTGPLGQGVASAVGFALGQALLAGKYNSAAAKMVQGRVWCLAGDGCMMEGIASEASSLAGHLGLGNLTVIYDKNDISIDGDTKISFTEDVALRYEAYGWQVIKVSAYDQVALAEAMDKSARSERKPTLIIATSVIGLGAATLEGSAATHGAALGVAELEATKKKMGWTLPPFEVPQAARDWCRARVAEKLKAYEAWQTVAQAFKKDAPQVHAAWDQQFEQVAPADMDQRVSAGTELDKGASRKHSGKAINALAKELPWFIGGSADLTESNSVGIKDGGTVGWGANGIFGGRNIYFGVREHAMGAIVNGLALHGAWRPYSATFLQFADYMRPSIRLAALMKARSIFVFTHDSVLLGEDGPTHQPVEHLAALRLIPGLTVWRPADGLETAMAWAWTATQARGPVALCFSRQNLPVLPYPEKFDRREIYKGAYVVKEVSDASVTLIATGSEVGTALETATLLGAQGLKARVVSMPSSCVFGRQDEAFKQRILGKQGRVVIEAGSTSLWPSVVGSNSLLIGVDSFGLSAPADDIAKHFDMTPPQITARVLAWNSSRLKVDA